ncbi:Uncharacterised protein [Ralstonia pickettii]|jgi:hypothetical protein|uniref:hypothetical protein n=2 Tax=Burkholderiaceae TaxID=119060 RepID=UPI0001E6938D|nr:MULTISPECIES: hypothetical protein [Ralstonia]EFP65533.1 hypothetical protein HMPREF1004_02810 [Ralstonia pickettii]EGY66348.1 hypothetical protein HMPREF0989_01035 [Ralstonia sp. 5_2_56FAA]KFL20945.1 putative transmembrane protein [Ralstonia pickettii]MBU6523043.1 hypothetical protein [Ralstonia sp. B265]QQK36051.1 hypothetical protein RP6297_02268 [Ralstonia pickettii]
MRLPASITAQPPVATEPSHLAATHVDPTEASDVEQAAAGPKPWWERVSGVVLGGAFSSVAAALIAVTGAIYVGMYHAPWVKSLASHTPTAEQAGDAMSVAMATGTANAAAPASTAAPAPTEAATPPASPDRVAAARDRMEQRVYSQVQQPRARTVAERETVEENEAPAPASPRRRHRSTRYMHHSAPFNAAWYKGA